MPRELLHRSAVIVIRLAGSFANHLIRTTGKIVAAVSRSTGVELRKRHVFICGCARSGTTELTHILNTHPLVCIGIERYATIYNRRQQHLCAKLFSEKRFFDFRPGDTFWGLQDEIANWHLALRPKIERAKVVGDKYPDIYECFDVVASQIQGARFIFIVRNVVDVAFSWDARANDPDDKWWTRRKDFAAAIEAWLRSLEAATNACSRGIPLYVVIHHDFFDGNGKALNRLLAFLEIAPDVAIEAAHRESAQRFLELRRHRAPHRLESIDSLVASISTDSRFVHFCDLFGLERADLVRSAFTPK